MGRKPGGNIKGDREREGAGNPLPNTRGGQKGEDQTSLVYPAKVRVHTETFNKFVLAVPSFASVVLGS